jgi:hypothetical protein
MPIPLSLLINPEDKEIDFQFLPLTPKQSPLSSFREIPIFMHNAVKSVQLQPNTISPMSINTGGATAFTDRDIEPYNYTADTHYTPAYAKRSCQELEQGDHKVKRKRHKSISYIKEVSQEFEMDTEDFYSWYLAHMKSTCVMERGIRIMHPWLTEMEYFSKTHEFSAPKITQNPFKLRFMDGVDEAVKGEYVRKGSIAMNVSFRCNGTQERCSWTEKRLNNSMEVKSVCKKTYDVKIYYSDLSKLKITLNNDHS